MILTAGFERNANEIVQFAMHSELNPPESQCRIIQVMVFALHSSRRVTLQHHNSHSISSEWKGNVREEASK